MDFGLKGLDAWERLHPEREIPFWKRMEGHLKTFSRKMKKIVILYSMTAAACVKVL